MTQSHLSSSANRKQDTLTKTGVALEVKELSSSTRTAVDAADSIGCEVGQIAKSLIFKGAQSGEPLHFVVSGVNLLNTYSAAKIVGESLEEADADFVRRHTGFAIGGAPPIGHISQHRTFVDADLLQHEQIWAAAGTPRAVFALAPDQLIQITGAEIIYVT